MTRGAICFCDSNCDKKCPCPICHDQRNLLEKFLDYIYDHIHKR